MGFPDNVLTRGEKVELKMHPHWRDIVGAIVMGLLLIAVSVYVAWLTPDDTKGNWIQWLVVLAAVLLAVPLVVVPILRWATTHYVVTTHRVLVRRGVLTKSGKDITLSKITDVSFTRTLLDRMLGSGTLNIESAGDSPDEMFTSIPHSDRVQQLVNRLIDQDANKRAERMVRRSGLSSDSGPDPTGAHRAQQRPEPRPEQRPEPRPEQRPEPRAEQRPEQRPEQKAEQRAEQRREQRGEETGAR